MVRIQSSRTAAATALLVLVALTRCSFPDRTFNDADYARLSQGAGGSAGASGKGGAGSGGDAGKGGDSGAGGDAGAGGEAGAGGDSGSAGDAGAAGSGGQGGSGAGGAGAGGAGSGGKSGGGQGGASGAGAGGSSGGGQGGNAGASCVDEGKSITCGVGPCTNTVKACDNGVPQTCTPFKPTLDICNNGVDDNCNDKIDEYCGPACTHDICTAAGALKQDCNPCVGAICETGKFAKCCSNSWGPDCIAAVAVVCEVALCKFQCTHKLCDTGAPLVANCDKPSAAGISCVAQICEAQPSCCTDTWDNECVKKVNSICGLGCALPGSAGAGGSG